MSLSSFVLSCCHYHGRWSHCHRPLLCNNLYVEGAPELRTEGEAECSVVPVSNLDRSMDCVYWRQVLLQERGEGRNVCDIRACGPQQRAKTSDKRYASVK